MPPWRLKTPELDGAGLVPSLRRDVQGRPVATRGHVGIHEALVDDSHPPRPGLEVGP